MSHHLFGPTMPAHSFEPIRGKFERFTFSSENLQNALGDPIEREVIVHVPLGIDGPVPAIIYLAPFGGTGFARANWRAFSETLPQRHQRLIEEGKMGPSILIMPETFTSLGGNQFINCEIMGDWGTWLAQDLRREIEQRYEVSGFGLVGKSSGGYGSLVRAMLDDCWGAVACHAGDCGFEAMFPSDILNCATAMQKYGDEQAYLAAMAEKKSLSGKEFHDLMTLAMAATYSDGTLPVDKFGLIDEEKWAQWCAWDPLNMIEDHRELCAVWLDVGDADQYHIQYGLRRLHLRMEQLGIAHEWEEFAGTHSGIDHRLDLSLPWLYSQLNSEP